ncbi:MAG: aspartoacylase [Coleofasciculaceae cyanobacterium]
MITNRISPIQRVLIVGGTHGNELTGIYLIKKLEKHPAQVRRSTFETVTLLANPKAFTKVRRYIDKDLNRCFRQQDLQDFSRFSYEEIRAREINLLFGKNSKTPVDVVLDLHSTTANMGLTVITDEQPFNLRLVAYLQSVNPLVKVYLSSPSKQEASGLPSICKLGCTIEVGVVAQGILQAEQFQQTGGLIDAALNYFEQHNRAELAAFDTTITVYRHVESLDYPRDEFGEIQGMIHPQIQFKDYEPLHPGEPIFITFDKETITYKGTSTVYPVFINEAAYYEKGIAMCLTEKQQLTI